MVWGLKGSGLSCIAAALVAASAAQTASAVVIGFETSEGYSTGVLAGNPSSGNKWTSSGSAGNAFQIVQIGGNQLVQTQSGKAYTTSYQPTLADIGLTSGQTLKDSLIHYSYTFSVDKTNETSAAHTLLRLRFGGTSSGGDLISDFEISSVGKFNYTVFDSVQNKIVSTGVNITSGTAYTISGDFNFNTKTFTLFINGTQILYTYNGVSYSDLAFRTQATDITSLYVTANQIVNGGTASFQFDNITLQTVPEAASVSVLGIGALTLLKKSR